MTQDRQKTPIERLIQDVSGECDFERDIVRLRVRTESGNENLLLSFGDIQALVTLLLLLSSCIGQTADDSSSMSRPTTMLDVDSIGLGESIETPTLLLDIGIVTLGFSLSDEIAVKLGQALLSPKSTVLPTPQ